MKDSGTNNTEPSDNPAPMRAGGRATEAGMSFQAEVGTWLAANMVADQAVGRAFGLAISA